MKLELDKYSFVVGWLCDSCRLYNDILTSHCKACHSHKDDAYFKLEIQESIRRGILIWYENGDTRCNRMTNDERVELHSKFFAQAGKLVIEMTYDQLVSWEEELEKIVIEAKASLQRSSQERRERQAKMSKAERDKLITNPDMSVTEGLIAPKLRRDRMSAADKVKADMEKMNIPQDMIDALMKGVSSSGNPSLATVKHDPKANNKGFVFNGTPTPIDEDGNPEVEKSKLIPTEERPEINWETKKDEPKSEPEPKPESSTSTFNPDSLFG